MTQIGVMREKKDVEEASKKANLLGLKVVFHLSIQWY